MKGRIVNTSNGCGLGAKALLACCFAVGVVLAQDSKPATQPPAPAPAAPAKQEPPKNLPPAKEILEKHVKAIGGKDAILKHTSKHVLASIASPMMPGADMKLDINAAKPNKMVYKVSTPQGDMTSGYDGKVAWANNAMMGPQILEGEQAKAVTEQADFYDELKDVSKYKSAETVDLADFEGKKCYKVHIVKNDGTETNEFYDADSGLQVGASQERKDMGAPMEVTTLVQDYKEFGGVKVATKMVMRMMGMEQTVTITSVEFDKVPDSAFDLPAEIKALKDKGPDNIPTTGTPPGKPAQPKPDAPKPDAPKPKP